MVSSVLVAKPPIFSTLAGLRGKTILQYIVNTCRGCWQYTISILAGIKNHIYPRPYSELGATLGFMLCSAYGLLLCIVGVWGFLVMGVFERKVRLGTETFRTHILVFVGLAVAENGGLFLIPICCSIIHRDTCILPDVRV